MQAEDLWLNHCCQWQVIKEICVIFPYVGIAIFAKALIVEPIHLSDLSRFVISSQNGDSILESDFKAHKQSHSLYWVISSIHIVAHE